MWPGQGFVFFFSVMGDEWVVRQGWPSTAEQKVAAMIIKGQWECRDSAPMMMVGQQCPRCQRCGRAVVYCVEHRG